MRRGQIAAVDLMMTLRAIGIERGLQCRAGADVAQQRRMIGTQWACTVSCVAAQAQKRRRLVKQVVCHRAMRIVTNTAILRYRRMFVCERTLLLGMAPITHHIDGWFLQVIFRLSVRIVAVGANHLAFFNRMVRRHCVLGIDV
jgi:hypothetical protein